MCYMRCNTWFDTYLVTASDELMWALIKMEAPMFESYKIFERRSTKMGLTFFEMRNELKSGGMCYAVREHCADEAWVIFYDAETGMFMQTDWIENEPWCTTIEELESDDWIIYRYII